MSSKRETLKNCKFLELQRKEEYRDVENLVRESSCYLTGITEEYATPKGYAVCDEYPNGIKDARKSMDNTHKREEAIIV